MTGLYCTNVGNRLELGVAPDGVPEHTYTYVPTGNPHMCAGCTQRFRQRERVQHKTPLFQPRRVRTGEKAYLCLCTSTTTSTTTSDPSRVSRPIAWCCLSSKPDLKPTRPRTGALLTALCFFAGNVPGWGAPLLRPLNPHLRLEGLNASWAPGRTRHAPRWAGFFFCLRGVWVACRLWPKKKNRVERVGNALMRPGDSSSSGCGSRSARIEAFSEF